MDAVLHSITFYDKFKHVSDQFKVILMYTLRTEGSRSVLPEGLSFYPEPFAFEQPFFEERVPEGFFVGLKVPLRTCFKNTFWKCGSLEEFFKDC